LIHFYKRYATQNVVELKIYAIILVL